MRCISCGRENKNTNIRCDFCGNDLNNKDYSLVDSSKISVNDKKANVIFYAILLYLLAPLFLFGLAFVVVSTYSNISDYNKSKNYLETEGKLIDYENCKENGETESCHAVYEYIVNGVTYKGSPNKLSDESGFKKSMIVKYNPNNPSEYVMDSGWNLLFVVGIIIVIVVLIIFISITKKRKKEI